MCPTFILVSQEMSFFSNWNLSNLAIFSHKVAKYLWVIDFVISKNRKVECLDWMSWQHPLNLELLLKKSLCAWAFDGAFWEQ